MVEHHPIFAKDRSRLHQLGPVLPCIFFGFALDAGRILQGDIMIADTEKMEQMRPSEIHARRLSARGSVNADER